MLWSGQLALVFQKDGGMGEVTNKASGPVEQSWRRKMEEVGVHYFVPLHPKGNKAISTNTCQSIQHTSSFERTHHLVCINNILSDKTNPVC